MERALALLSLLALTACTGAAGETYIGQPGSPAWFATADKTTIAAFFVDRCTSYGFKPGTVEMAQCVQQESNGQRSRNSAQIAAAAQVNANIAVANAANRPTRTTCNRFGNTVNCTTF